jgi:hypothetical protein
MKVIREIVTWGVIAIDLKAVGYSLSSSFNRHQKDKVDSIIQLLLFDAWV